MNNRRIAVAALLSLFAQYADGGRTARKVATELKAAAGAICSQGMYDFPMESHFGDLRFRQQRYDEARVRAICC
jgi:hypothetical protein